MRFLRTYSCLLVLLAFCVLVSATDKNPKSAKSDGPVLPNGFSGWTATASTPSASFDPEHTAALKEFGLTGVESRAYERNGRSITVKALKFPDATGAYGAFTLLREPQMAEEKLCNQGASDGTHVLFYCGNVLLEVNLDKVTAMSTAELRALAATLPKLSGESAKAPDVPLYLPENIRQRARFALGPEAFSAGGSPLPSDLVDFSKSPEVAVSRFQSVDGIGTVTVIKYPTPAIATQQLKKIQEWSKSRPAPETGSLNTFNAKRSFALVAVVTGDIANAEAQFLLDKINYEADVTWNEAAPSQKNNIGNLVYMDMVLAFIIVGGMIIAGVMFGGFRIMLRKLFPGRFIDRPEDVEFIQLNLADEGQKSINS